MKEVVLPHSHDRGGMAGAGQHHKDPLHQFEGVLFVLIGIHLCAFAYWGWLLYISRERKKLKLQAGRAGAGASSGPGSAEGSSGAEWRTPKDILRAYQKQQMGKG